MAFCASQVRLQVASRLALLTETEVVARATKISGLQKADTGIEILESRAESTSMSETFDVLLGHSSAEREAIITRIKLYLEYYGIGVYVDK